MQSLLPLKSFYGLEKTLVITCHECIHQEETSEQVFSYQCLGNVLRKADKLQEECIRYYIESVGCTQILLAGHYNCQIIQKMLDEAMENNSRVTFFYNMDSLVKENSQSLLQPAIKNRMLVELNVIEQVKLIMSYDFVYEKVSSGVLKVVGAVIDYKANTTREIFRNGMNFNNLIVLN